VEKTVTNYFGSIEESLKTISFFFFFYKIPLKNMIWFSLVLVRSRRYSHSTKDFIRQKFVHAHVYVPMG